ncbi:MAG TPA: UDP-3-O-(3-hydroxymyristoyl)glucosamine N-acyltransferase [Pyrinomonadaceae bacterium]|nr:UDP-3-O-(3-hydroxymyristoyl)glucosamine N-acyltransferase [Pyrinomonadaceae bacterium]
MTQSTISVRDLAEHVSGNVVGDGTILIQRIANLENAGEGAIAYVDNEKHLDAAATSNASCLIIPNAANNRPQFKSSALIEVSNPKLAFSQIAAILHPPVRREPAIDPTAVLAKTADVALTAFIGPNVCIGEYARIGPYTRVEAGAVIGANVSVGSECAIHPNVVLYDGVSIGDRVILHAGVCIGADGFGYVRDEMGYHKFPQIGTVVIEDEVELGAHTCVDRAALGQTRIGKGTKLDNMVHVGHNCDIGERVVIAAQTGISGSVTIEDDAVIGGQVGFGDHTHVQSGAVIGSKAGILPGKIVRPGVWWGIPIQPLSEYKRMNAHLGRLPEMREELKQLRQRVKDLEDKLTQK